MKYLNLVIIWSLMVFASSCKIPQYATVNMNFAPKLSLRPDSNVILLINLVKFDQSAENSPKKLIVLKSGAFTAIKYAGSQLKKLPHVKVISLVDSASFNVTTDSIKSLAAAHHANYVLALNNFSAVIALDGIDNYTSYYSSSVQVNYTLYQNDGVFSKKLAGTDNAQTQTPYIGLLGSLIIHPTVKGNKQAINASAERATQNALQNYLPYYTSYQWPLFNDSYLQPAVTEILAGAFDKAYNLLQPFLKDSNKVISSKAYYNLAVVYEAQGDIDLAIENAQISLDKNKNDYAQSLLTELKRE